MGRVHTDQLMGSMVYVEDNKVVKKEKPNQVEKRKITKKMHYKKKREKTYESTYIFISTNFKY